MRVLVVKTSSLGDVIHTLPALTDAQQFYPDIRFDWVVERAFADIPKLHESIDKVIVVDIRHWRHNIWQTFRTGKWKRFRRQIKQRRYDYVIDAQGLIKSAIITRMAKGIRCGLDRKSIKESLAIFAYKRKFRIPKDQHAVTRVRQLFANVLGYKLPSSSPDYGIRIEVNDKKSDNYLVFIHGSSRPNKCWMEDNWIELSKAVADSGLIVKLPWGNDEEHNRAKRIADRCHNIQVLSYHSLSEMIAVLKRAKCVISVDTGLGHLAAALNVPTISLYGPTNPKLVGTYGKNQIHLQSKGSLERISVSDVWKKLQFFL